MLCTACQSIFRDELGFDLGWYGERKRHLTAQSLYQAVRQNCYICTAIYERCHEGDDICKLDPLQFTERVRSTKCVVALIEDYNRGVLVVDVVGDNSKFYV